MTGALELFEHGPLILRVLTELRPRRVSWVGADVRFGARLSEYATTVGFELTAESETAELVISSAGDYDTVQKLLSHAAVPPVPVVVGGTAWPCGRRDARRDLQELPAAERERYAFQLPVPGQIALGDCPSPIAFANIEGGPRNGVRTAVEDVCREAPGTWDVRLLPGFGGVAVLLPAALASVERWAAIAPAGGDDALVARLELDNVQLRLDRERLIRELDRVTALIDDQGVAQQIAALEQRLALGEATGSGVNGRRRPGLGPRLAAVVRELDERLARDRVQAQASDRALATEQARRMDLATWLRDEPQRSDGDGEDGVIPTMAEDLRRLLEELEHMARAYEEQRTFVRMQATRISRSRTWRWGHRLAMVRSRLLLRPNRGTDAVTRLLERTTATPPLLGPTPGPEVSGTEAAPVVRD